MTYDNDRYYIFDCANVLCGNPLGYKTMSSALSIANRRTGKVYYQIYDACVAKIKANGYYHVIHTVTIGSKLNEKV